MRQGQDPTDPACRAATTTTRPARHPEARASTGPVNRHPSEFIPIVGGLWIALCGVMIPHGSGDYWERANAALWRGDFPYELVPVVLFVTALHLASILDRRPTWRRALAWWTAVGWLAVSGLMLWLHIPLGAGLTFLLTLRSSSAYFVESGSIRRRSDARRGH